MSGLRGGLVRWGALVGLVLAVCAGCDAAVKHARSSPPPLTPATMTPMVTAAGPPPCQTAGCRTRQTVTLPGGDTISLWYGDDQQNYASRPVLELARSGQAVQWWTAPQGDGWNGALTCLTGAAEPNCVLTDSLGMHAGVAELVIVRDGRMVHPPGGQVVTNSGGISAADLDGDGYLDVVGVTNDYSPNFAQGHSFWQTFHFADDRYASTGCAPKTASPPTGLLTGTCPVVAR